MTTNKQVDWHFLIRLTPVPVWLLCLSVSYKSRSYHFILCLICFSENRRVCWAGGSYTKYWTGCKSEAFMDRFLFHEKASCDTHANLTSFCVTLAFLVNAVVTPATWGFNYYFSISVWFQPPAGVSMLPWYNGFSLKLIRTWGEGRTRARKQLLRLHVQVCTGTNCITLIQIMNITDLIQVYI